MLHKVIKLTDEFKSLRHSDFNALSEQRQAYIKSAGLNGNVATPYAEPTLTVYCPDNSQEIDSLRRRPSVLLFPGGGYEFTSFREAEPVALSFICRGFNAFVLNYEVAPVRYPQALLQASAAVAFIRRHADEFNAYPDKIAVCGFSAGGHLSASLGVFWSESFISESLGLSYGENRPNAMILNYPVITSGTFAHRGSFNALLGKDVSQEMLEKMSLEKQVNDKTPPAFLWHTFEDDCVPVENSLMFAQSLKEKSIPFELHIYPKGGHGLSLCSHETDNTGEGINPHCGTWLNLCTEWLDIVLA